MNLSSTDQTLQLIAWFLALTEFILALYVLLVNAWHMANRHVSALLVLLAANNFALGLLIGATDATQAALPTRILAATTPAIQPGLLIVAVVLLKPQWLHDRWRWLWRILYSVTFLPALLTLVDVSLGTRLWYTGLDAASYAGGYAARAEFTGGNLSPLVRVLNIYMIPIIAIVPLLYVALRDKKAKPLTRRTAQLLLGAQVAAIVVQFMLRNLLSPEVTAVVMGLIFVVAYAYAAFQQMISERRLQRGRLQARLTALILGITLPLIIAVVTLVNTRAAELITRNATDKLSATNQALAANVGVWLDLNAKALGQLASLPDIVGMDPERQKPFLEAMTAAYPHMYLVSTTDRDGFNVARSDDLPNQDYNDRLWQIGARNGAPLTFDVVATGRTTDQPALVASVPIKRELGTIVGVAMFASRLTDVAEAAQAARVGETGFAYVVDTQNRVVAHPDPTISAQLQDFNTYPPVFDLRGGARGPITFTDDQGQSWRAHVDVLENGWGVIVQQQESDFLSSLRRLNQITWVVIIVGVGMLSFLAWLIIRQTFQPVASLTETATAITAGDLTRTAPVESEDEIGVLAQAFNSMTVQLRELIGSLEQQVADRTRALARRSAYLEASAEVSRAVSSILEPDQLFRQVVDLIRKQFELYYVGLFVWHEGDEWAILRAGTGEAGRAMLARGHRIRIGEGMIGWSIANGEARISLQADQDAIRLATAELPDTRSEAAIPLRSRGQVLGALTVQSDRPNAFDQTAIAALQTMADQVAVALNNASLFAEKQTALDAARRAYGVLTHRAWAEVLHARRDLSFRSDKHGVTSAQEAEAWRPEMERALQEGQTIRDEDTRAKRNALAVPIKIGDEVIGVLDTYKPGSDGEWTPQEVALVEDITEQLALALDSARLYQDTRRRAAIEQLTGEVSTHMRETLDIETVLQTAVDEIYQALRLDELSIHLSSGTLENSGDGNTPETMLEQPR